MNVDDLPGAARRVSTAILPPISHLAAVAATILFIFGYDAIVHVFSIDVSDLLPSQETVRVLQFYGIAAITPVVVGVLLLVVAHGLQSVLTWLGSRLPPHLSSNTTMQMRAATDEWTLRRLWALHPSFDPVNGLNMLNVATDEAVAQAEADPKAHHRLRQLVSLRDRAIFHRAQMRFTKGMIVIVVPSCFTAVLIDEGLRSIGRAGILLALGGAWAFYHGVRLIESEHAYFRAKVQTYLEVQEALRGEPLQPHSDNRDVDRKRMDELNRLLARVPAWTLSWRQRDDDINARKQLISAISRFLRGSRSRTLHS